MKNLIPARCDDLRIRAAFLRAGVAAVLALLLVPACSSAQDRIKTMPGYDQYQRMAGQMQGAFRSGALNVTWLDDGTAFDYQRDGRRYRYTVATRAVTDLPAEPGDGMRGRRGP